MTDIRSQAPALVTGEFRVGRVLSRSFEILVQDFVKFFLVALIVVAPYGLLAFAGGMRTSFTGPAPNFSAAGIGLGLAAVFGAVFLYPLSQAVTLYGAFQDMRGRPFNMGEAFARAFARFSPLLGLAIAWGFAVILGMILLIVPGLMLLASFYVSLPACVVEGLGPLQSMSRSAALTKGHRWKVFGIYVLIVIVSSIIGSVIRLAFAGMTGLIGAIFAGLIWNALFAAYHSVVVAVMYHDLRVLKEGIDIERIAAVFD